MWYFQGKKETSLSLFLNCHKFTQKTSKLESATREEPDIGPTVCQGRGKRSKRDTVDLVPRAIAGAGGLFSQ